MGIENEKYSTNQDSVATELLKQAKERFNLENIGENEELYRILSEVQSYSSDEKSKEGQVEIEGTLSDGFEHLEEFLSQSFSETSLSQSLTSRITLRPDIVHLHIDGKNFYLTEKEYTDWLQVSPQIKNFKVRAENFTTFNTTGWLQENFEITKNIPLPIIVYGFQGDSGEGLSYLENITPEKRDSLYKLGTVSHEIAHHLFSYQLTPEQKEEFFVLATAAPALTEYSEKYKSKAIYIEEQFCESIRLLTTNAGFLEQKAPELYKWLKTNFPDLKEFNQQTQA